MNLSNKIYTDICYHFETPNGRDIPLSERIHIFYPNITLCERGCINIGINLSTNESICKCTYNNILNSEILENKFLEEALGDVKDIISNSNLDVLKCYKNIFDIKNFKICYGGFIILTIIFLDVCFSIILMSYELGLIIKYIYCISEKYINLINKKKTKYKK